MLKFKEFLSEEYREVVDIDARHLENNADALNAELDTLTEKPYQNAPIFLAQLRGVLERYGMLLPQSATRQFMELGSELVYVLGDTNLHLYVVYDTNEEGFVEGYAQVVDNEELKALTGLERADYQRENAVVQPRRLRARTDDDSGYDSEYSYGAEVPNPGWESPSQVSDWRGPAQTSDWSEPQQTSTWTAPAQVPNP